MSSRLDAHCSCSNFHKPEKVGAFAARPYRQDYSTLSPSKTQSIWLGPPGSAIQAGGRRSHHRCTRGDPTFRHSGVLLFAACAHNSIRGSGWISTGVGGDEVIPAAPTTPRTKPNDIWILGEHRVGCGDGRDAEFLQRVIGEGARVDAAFLGGMRCPPEAIASFLWARVR